MAKAGPPPLKRRSSDSAPPLRKKGPRPVDDDQQFSLDLPADMLTTSSSVTEDPTSGEWLFKDGDVVKGPVSSSILVEAIDEGTITEDTPIGREVGQWRPLREIPFFRRALDAAAENRRAEGELRVERQRRRTRNILRAVVVLIFVIGPFLGGVIAGRMLMVAQPWNSTKEWVRRIPPLVDLPPKPKPAFVAKVDPTPPPVADVEEPADDDDGDDKGNKRDSRNRRNKNKRDKRDNDKAGDKAGDKPAAEATSTDALPNTLTEDQVKAGLQKGFNGFKACIKQEFGKNADLPSRVTLAFSIANDGRAIEVKLLERQVRDGPLAGCIKGVVSGLRWPKFYGERRYAEFPFNIGPRK